MLPSTADRVPRNTDDDVNQRIEQSTLAVLERAAAGGSAAIGRRLHDIEHEWDIERAIEANAAGLALVGVALGAFVNLWFLLLPALVAAFLLQHALQGWCPPVPVLRRFGYRTQTEIERERHALKALRGDYRTVDGATVAGPSAAPSLSRLAYQAAHR